jgi:hypothetical protein
MRFRKSIKRSTPKEGFHKMPGTPGWLKNVCGHVVKCTWDHEWGKVHYNRLGEMIVRILKPGGTAYVWGGIGTYKSPNRERR